MIKVASIQLWHNDNDSKQARINHVEELIDSVADSDLIVLPEVWNIGWWSFDMYNEGSETLQGETISRLAEKAKAINAYMLAGSIIERKDDSLYNTAVLLDPKGKINAVYRKIHLVGFMGREAELLKPGEEIVTVKTDLGILGFSICYDLEFPELFRKMAVNHSVEIFLLVAAWLTEELDHWREQCHVRAYENHCFLIASDLVGTNRGNGCLGHSCVVDPWGISIASAGIHESIVKCEIDTAEIHKIRKLMPNLEDRRLSI